METTIEAKESIAKKTVLYTGVTHTTGGREGGASKSSDGNLDIKLSTPGKGNGTNPEQLFAAGWSAFPGNAAVNTEVDLLSNGEAYSLQARLHVSLPGLDEDTARTLADTAHQICPYSKATRGNIDVAI